MAKCPELFHKFKEYSESCGIGNPKDMERHIEIAEGISNEFGIHVDKIYLLFPMTASKKLGRYPKNSDIRKNVVEKIADAINNNVKVTSKTVEIWLHDEGVPLKLTTISPGKVAKKINIAPDLIQNGSIKTRIHALKSVLTPGQVSILNDIMIQYNHDDELGALSLALIWAKEKMENERRS